MGAREGDRDAERAGALVDGLAAGAELHPAGSVMVSVLTEGLPRTEPPVGVPRVNVSVWLGPGSERSVPVMFWVVCPIPNVSGLAVRPLKAVPETAVPPSVNGTVTVSADLAHRVAAAVGDVEVAGGVEGQADGARRTRRRRC